MAPLSASAVHSPFHHGRQHVVVLNDPQTAAMSVPLQRAGATVIWSCHIGIDHDNEYSRNAWRCLRPRLTGVRRFVFSRYTSLPEWLAGRRRRS